MATDSPTICWCVDCQESFQLTAGETTFYLSRWLQLPKRCQDCRDRRRNSEPVHDPDTFGNRLPNPRRDSH